MTFLMLVLYCNYGLMLKYQNSFEVIFLRLISEEISRAEHKHMNMHFSPISTVVTDLIHIDFVCRSPSCPVLYAVCALAFLRVHLAPRSA